MRLFLSDSHLGFFERDRDRRREDLLLDVLRAAGRRATEVFIVGDLFDFWFDYKSVVPREFYRTLAALSELRGRGVNIYYLIGNHDFGHYDFFSKELGIDPLPGDLEITLDGKKFYISHGDGKAYNDLGYKILKKILRSRLNQFLYRKLHPDWAINMARTSSKKSRNYTDARDFGSRDGQRDFAERKLREGFDYVVMGHRHVAKLEPIAGGWYCNLGEWLRSPHCATFDGGELNLMPVEEFLTAYGE